MGVSGKITELELLDESSCTNKCFIGLLNVLKSIHKPCHLRDFKGKTLAVDAYAWLHRGAIACAIELATGKPTTKYNSSSYAPFEAFSDHRQVR